MASLVAHHLMVPARMDKSSSQERLSGMVQLPMTAIVGESGQAGLV